MTHFNAHSVSQNSHIKSLDSSQAYQAASAATKSLGSDPGLAQWMEENQYLYNQIQHGTSELSPMDASQFMEWWNWAQSSLNGMSGSWDMGSGGIDVIDGYSDPGAGASMAQSDPFGGIPGTMGNLVHNEEKATVGMTGDATRDFWCNEVTLQFAMLSAKVTVDRTMDTRFNPPEDVIRVTGIDKATNATAVYYIHIDDPDHLPKINIQTPNESQLTDSTGGLVEWKKFSGAKPSDAPAECDVEAIDEDGTLVYEGRAGETIHFNSKGNGEDQEHMVWGSADISVGTRDRVAVYQSEMTDPSSPDAPIPATKVVVTHSDGSTDTYYQPQGMDFKLNINATESRVTWGTHPAGSTDGVPEEFADLVSLNAAAVSEDEAAVEVAGDEPSSVEGTDRVFDQNASADLYTRKDGGTSTVFARNDVTLHASDNKEYWVVSWDDGEGRYVVQVYADDSKSELKETIYLDDMLDNLKLDIDQAQVEYADELHAQDNIHALNPESTEAERISLLNAAGEAEGDQGAWPTAGAIQSNILRSDNGDQAQRFADAVDEAIAAGDAENAWDRVLFLISNMPANVGNDIIRKFLTGLNIACGGDDWKMEQALDLIPANVRQAMSAKVWEHEWERGDGASRGPEQNTGDLYNTVNATERLNNSLQA